ncbi:hypothetical protein ES707_14622 [subsurface metagenome]
MNTSRWSIDKIMQLPDWCFGRRWWIGEYLGSTNGTVDYRLGKENLPDYFVVWGILIACRSSACLEAMRVTVRLGTVLPAAPGDVNRLDRIYKGISIPSITYEFYPDSNGVKWIDAGRIVHESKGRRLVIMANGDQVIQYEMTVGMLISAVPREVPNWLSGT